MTLVLNRSAESLAAEAARALAAAKDAARAECRRRILAVCDETAQINLAAAVAAGMIAGDDLDTYRAGLAWVDAMRGTWEGLAEAGADLADDANWPDVPAGVAELAARY